MASVKWADNAATDFNVAETQTMESIARRMVESGSRCEVVTAFTDERVPVSVTGVLVGTDGRFAGWIVDLATEVARWTTFTLGAVPRRGR